MTENEPDEDSGSLNDEDEPTEEYEDFGEDEDEDGRVAGGPHYLSRFLLLLMFCAFALEVWEALSPPRPPPVDARREMEEDQGPIPEAPRTFYLVVKPLLSGTDGIHRFFGEHYGGLAVYKGFVDLKARTLTDMEEKGDDFLSASLQLSLTWLQVQGKAIFNTICNFEHQGPPLNEFFGYGHVNFVRCNRRGDQILFEFRETSPGSASLQFLRFLRDEVRSGSDTWDCADFGDVTQSIAVESGFGSLWAELLASPVTTSSAAVRLRVTLSDVNAQVLDADGRPVPEERTKCVPQNFNFYGQQRLPFQRIRIGEWF